MDENKKIQDIQIMEQNLQNILLQKQAFQMELSEIKTALSEVESSGDDVFRIIGQLMIKANKDSVKSDLLNKKKILELRLNNFEKQENTLNEQIEKIRSEILNK